MLDRTQTSNISSMRDMLTYGDLVLDPEQCSLSCGEKSTSLGFPESLVLQLLIRSGGQTTYYDILLEALRQVSAKAERGMPILRGAVFALRNRLRMIGARTIIHVSSRVGYYLAPPEPRVDRLRVAFDTTFGRS